MVIPYMATINWIESLNLLIVNDWRPFFVDEQVAGLVVFSLAFNHLRMLKIEVFCF